MGSCAPPSPPPRRRWRRAPALLLAAAATAAAAAAVVTVRPAAAATVSAAVADEAPPPPPPPDGGGAPSPALVLPAGEVAILTAANFTAAVAPPPPALAIVAFKVPWCGHCQALTAPYAEAAVTLGGTQPTVRLAAVDASAAENAALNKAHVTVGYPTIKAFSAGVLVDEFRGVRDVPHLTAWVDKVVRTSGRSPVVALPGSGGGRAAGGSPADTGKKGKKRKGSRADAQAGDTLEGLLAEGPPLLVLLDRSTASPALAAAFEAAVTVLRMPPLDLPLARFASTPHLGDEPAVVAAVAAAPTFTVADSGVGVPPLPLASPDDVALLWRRSLAYGSTEMSLVRRLRVRDAAAVAAGSLAAVVDGDAAAGRSPPPPTDDAVAAVVAWAYDASVHPVDAFLVDSGNLPLLTGAVAPLLLAFGPDALPPSPLAAVLSTLPSALHPPPGSAAAADATPGGRTVGRVAYVQRGAFPDLDAHVLAGSDDGPPVSGDRGPVDWAVYRRGARRVERCVFGVAAWASAVHAAGTNEEVAAASLAATLTAWSAACAAGALDVDPMAGVAHGEAVAPSGAAYVTLKAGTPPPSAAPATLARLTAAAANLSAGVLELGGPAGWRPWVDNADGLVVVWLVPAAGCSDSCAARDAVVRAAAAILAATTDTVAVVRLPVGVADPSAAADVPPPLRRALEGGRGGRASADAPALLLLSADPAVPDVVLRGPDLVAAAPTAAALVHLALAAAEPRPLGVSGAAPDGGGVGGDTPSSTARAADSGGVAAGGGRQGVHPAGLLFGWLLVAAAAGLLGVEVAGGRAVVARVVRVGLAPAVR